MSSIFSKENWFHLVPVLDESIPATGYHLGSLVRMPQAGDTHCVVRFELAAGKRAKNKVGSLIKRENRKPRTNLAATAAT